MNMEQLIFIIYESVCKFINLFVKFVCNPQSKLLALL